jgi:hypothetical protein
MYEAVFKSPADVHVEFWDYAIHGTRDVFWAVGAGTRHLPQWESRQRLGHSHNTSFPTDRWPLAPDAPPRINRKARNCWVIIRTRSSKAQRQGKSCGTWARMSNRQDGTRRRSAQAEARLR